MEAMFSSLNPAFPATEQFQAMDWVPMIRPGVPGPETIYRLPASIFAGADVTSAKMAELSIASNAAFTDDAELQVDLAPGVYRIRVWLSVLTGNGGSRAKLEYTGTVTWIEASGIILRSGLPIFGRITAMSGYMNNTNTGNSAFFIDGTINVATAGTLKVQESQDSSDVDPTVIHHGSYLATHGVPAIVIAQPEQTGPVTVVKSTDEARGPGSTTLALDNELVLPVEAGATYLIEVGMMVTIGPSNSGGFDLAVGGSATVSQMTVTGKIEQSEGESKLDFLLALNQEINQSGSSLLGQERFGSLSGTIVVATSGTIGPSWSQGSFPDADTTTVLAGSYMKLLRIE